MKIAPSPCHILLVSSLSDPAGSLIHEEIRRLLQEKPDIAERYTHLQVQERLIYLDGSSFQTDADVILFLSRHASVNPQPVLTVHVTGNYGAAAYGGEPNTLTPAATSLMHALMNNLAKYAPAGYSVSYEATHHGPTNLSKPSCFIEVGSTETEWHDRIAAAAVAQAVLDAVPGNVITLAGFGGTHYAKRQTEITLTTRGAFGHIMPTRDLRLLTQELFDSIIRCTGAESVYIDKKAVSRDEHHKIVAFASHSNIPIIGQSDLQNIQNLPFEEFLLVIQKSKEIFPDAVVTFHNPVSFSDPHIISISPSLVEEVLKVNFDKFYQEIEKISFAHVSGNGIACHPIFIVNRSEGNKIKNDLIRLCISILTDYYQNNIILSEPLMAFLHGEDEFQNQEFDLKIIENRFDPLLAKKHGILPGKDFGKLARGESISIQGKIVLPQDVMITHIRMIKID
jgi:D-aminoacyl-tRNA deacylase